MTVTDPSTMHCAEECKLEHRGGGSVKRGRENRGTTAFEPSLEIQAVLPHHRGANVSSNWTPIQPWCLLRAEPGAVIVVIIIREPAQRILCEVEASAPLATDGVLVEVAIGWRLSNKIVGGGIG